MSKKQIYKPKPISGFPEWLPDVRRVEHQWFDHIRRVFESYGYCNIETPSVEELDVLNAKGGSSDSNGGDDVDKEVYVIERLHKDENDKDARLALHFDQTVPLARYVAQHFNDLIFPFKRYQIQRVWRGERPQAGRFREFYQCDIDVINVDQLPLHFDGEAPAIIWEILSSLPGMENEQIQIRISNRKILIGALESLGVKNVAQATRIIDKMDKIGEDEVRKLLIDQADIPSPDTALPPLLALCKIKSRDGQNLREQVESILSTLGNAKSAQEGLEELAFVMDQLSHLPEGAVVADLSIVRGLDYYTGTVYETVFLDDPAYGSICSGGRYDDLASSYINKKLPGVGISIGFSRLFDRIRQKGALPATGVSPAHVLVASPYVPNDLTTPPEDSDLFYIMQSVGRALRLQSGDRQGLNVEVWHAPKGKLKKQIAYAEKKGIRYVWFPPYEEGGKHEVKDLKTGEQMQTDPESWGPDA